MVPEVRFALPDGDIVVGAPGAVIGRSYTADIRIDDGRISEMHAYVSLRASQFVLFALRGRVRCAGRDAPRLELKAGMRIELAPDYELEVITADRPQHVLAIEADGVARQLLLGVTSVMVSPAPHLVVGHQPDAAALIWSDGLAWRVRIAGLRVRPLRAGDTVVIKGHAFRAIAEPSAGADVIETTPHASDDRLRIVSRFDSVQVWREGASEPCLLGGMPARLVAELLALGGPARWEAVAEEMWGTDVDPTTLRHRLDVTLLKTRRLLAAGQIRRDLLTSHRNGWVELLLYPGDVADDLA